MPTHSPIETARLFGRDITIKGTTMPWGTILPILQLIWSAVSPSLKAAALTELKGLEVADAAQPLLVALIKEAEVLVQAA